MYFLNFKKRSYLTFVLAAVITISMFIVQGYNASASSSRYASETIVMDHGTGFIVECTNYLGETDEIAIKGFESGTLSVYVLDNDNATLAPTFYFDSSYKRNEDGYISGFISRRAPETAEGAYFNSDEPSWLPLVPGIQRDYYEFYFTRDLNDGYTFYHEYILLTPSMADEYIKTGVFTDVDYTSSEGTTNIVIPGLRDLLISAQSNVTATSEIGAQYNYDISQTASSILIDNHEVTFDAFLINGSNYFKLRDLAYALNGSDRQFNVRWDENADAISIITGTPYRTVGVEMTKEPINEINIYPTQSKILVDGNAVEFNAYNINDNNFFKLRDIGKSINFGIRWDESKDLIIIDTSSYYIEP